MKKNNTIVFDLDDVVFDWISHFLDYIREKFPEVPVGNADRRCCTKWEFLSKFGIDRKRQMEIYSRYCDDEMFIETPILDRNIPKIINQLGEEYNIVFATARPKKSCEASAMSLHINNIKFDRLYCVGGYLDETPDGVMYDGKTKKIIPLPNHHFKSDVFKDEKPILAIDDNPVYLLEAYEGGVPNCLLMKRLHNIKWRKENPHYASHIDGARMYFVGPSWKDVNQSIKNCLKQEVSA